MQPYLAAITPTQAAILGCHNTPTMLTLFGKIAQHLLGTKYYCVTIEQRSDANGIGQRMLSSFIFTERKQATEFYHRTKYSNRSFDPVEIVSFRSREKYTTHSDYWNFCLNN